MPAQLKPTGGLEGCGVLVTGGGTGIGAACARVAAADGAAVTTCGRPEATLAASVEKIAPVADHGGRVRYVIGDVTDEDDVKRIVEAATEPTGGFPAYTLALQRIHACHWVSALTSTAMQHPFTIYANSDVGLGEHPRDRTR